jgi:hypothetical protein
MSNRAHQALAYVGQGSNGRTVDVLFDKQSETKSLNAVENCPSKTGGLALGMRNRTRIAIVPIDKVASARDLVENRLEKEATYDGTRRGAALLWPSR